MKTVSTELQNIKAAYHAAKSAKEVIAFNKAILSEELEGNNLNDAALWNISKASDYIDNALEELKEGLRLLEVDVDDL